MSHKSLEELLRANGGPVNHLRNSPSGPNPYPVVQSEYTNWRDEQHAWQHAAHVDRIEDVRGGERAHHVAARLVLGEQTFLGEQRQRLTHRGARHAERIGERGLRDALPRGELRPQDHLADAHDGLGELGIHWRGMLDFGSQPVNFGSQLGHKLARSGRYRAY